MSSSDPRPLDVAKHPGKEPQIASRKIKQQPQLKFSRRSCFYGRHHTFPKSGRRTWQRMRKTMIQMEARFPVEKKWTQGSLIMMGLGPQLVESGRDGGGDEGGGGASAPDTFPAYMTTDILTSPGPFRAGIINSTPHPKRNISLSTMRRCGHMKRPLTRSHCSTENPLSLLSTMISRPPLFSFVECSVRTCPRQKQRVLANNGCMINENSGEL